MVGVVAYGHHRSPGFELQTFGGKHVLLQTFHQIDWSCGFGEIFVRLLVDFEQAHVVERVRLLVDGKQIDGLLTRFGDCAQSGEEHIAIVVVHATVANIGQYGEQTAVILTMLFGQVTDCGIQFPPYQ